MKKLTYLLYTTFLLGFTSELKADQIEPIIANNYEISGDFTLESISVQNKTLDAWEEIESIIYSYSDDGNQITKDRRVKIDDEFVQKSITIKTLSDNGLISSLEYTDLLQSNTFDQFIYYNDDYSFVDSIKFVDISFGETYLETVVFDKISEDSLRLNISYEEPDINESEYDDSIYAILRDGNYTQFQPFSHYKGRFTYYKVTQLEYIQFWFSNEFIELERQVDRLYLDESDWVPYKRVQYEKIGDQISAIITQIYNRTSDKWEVSERINFIYQEDLILEKKISSFSDENLVEETKRVYSYQARTNNEIGDYFYSFELSQNYPNPFNPSTNISFNLPESSDVNLKVFNVNGQEIVTLVSAIRSAGIHTVQFDANSLASGVYYYQLRIGNQIQTKSMMLIK